MDNFYQEYADMHLVLEAARMYQQKYPNRREPCAKTFLAIDML